jgi:hypothetical protein
MKRPKFNTWGDAELDRLWLQMYEIEMSMDDLDLAKGNQKLQRYEQAAQEFRERMSEVDRIREGRYAGQAARSS